jgi:hypothetical protein
MELWRNIKLLCGMSEERAGCMKMEQIDFTFINEILIGDNAKVEAAMIINFNSKR